MYLQISFLLSTNLGSSPIFSTECVVKLCLNCFFVENCFMCTFEDFEQDGEENESDPDIVNDPINQMDLQVFHLAFTGSQSCTVCLGASSAAV